MLSITKLPEGSWAKISVLLLLAFLGSRWVCSRQIFQPTMGFLLYPEKALCHIDQKKCRGQKAGQVPCRNIPTATVVGWGCVWHTDWFQAVSDTCHSVTPTPFLTPSSHYLEGYVLQTRSLSDFVSCCLISVFCSSEIFLITTLLMDIPLCCPFITPFPLYLLDETWHSQQTLLN